MCVFMWVVMYVHRYVCGCGQGWSTGFKECNVYSFVENVQRVLKYLFGHTKPYRVICYHDTPYWVKV